MISHTVSVSSLSHCWRQNCTASLLWKVFLWSSLSTTVKPYYFLCPNLMSKLASVSLHWPVGSFRVPSDCAVLLLVTVWRWVFDCGSLEWINRDKALVPVRGSHSGPCFLSHFPDKPNCMSQECPSPNPCPAWPLRCLAASRDWPLVNLQLWCS